ncbi:MAG: hypothetical protein NVS9B7_19840 [Flavisolibacter sp.]
MLVKYFKESFRPNLIGKKKEDVIHFRLADAFDGKEKEWVLNDLGMEAASDPYFKMLITKVGLIEPRALNEEFFMQLFQGEEIKTAEAFRNKLTAELEKQWESESKNQLQHSLYHLILTHTVVEYPEDFLKRWLKSQGENNTAKTDEQVEQEFPSFINQLKWSLITDKLIRENEIQVQQSELRQFAKQQLLGYMGGQALDEEQQWVRDYIDKMMKDKKYVEDAFNRMQTQKLFEWAENQIQKEEVLVSKEDFIKMNEDHQHHHH